MRHPIVKQMASIVSAMQRLTVGDDRFPQSNGRPDRFAVPFAFQRFDAQ